MKENRGLKSSSETAKRFIQRYWRPAFSISLLLALGAGFADLSSKALTNNSLLEVRLYKLMGDFGISIPSALVDLNSPEPWVKVRSFRHPLLERTVDGESETFFYTYGNNLWKEIETD